MSSSDADDLVAEITKMKKKLKKLSRRHRRHRHDSRHRSRHFTRSRSRSRIRTRSASPMESPHHNQPIQLSPPTDEQQEKENVDPVIIIEENPENAQIQIPEELLVALGDEKPTEEKYGSELNGLISSRWENLLLNESEEVKDILKSHKIPKNCLLLEAPELNPEVKAALTDSARTRDQMLQAKQQQLGIALSCLGQAMTKILVGNEVSETLKLLSDGAKLLTSLHHKETNTRKQLLAPLLDKSFIKMTESIPRNQYLFGDNLAEKIKSNKEIEKSGLQLRKPKPPTNNRPGNWTGPSRQNMQQKNTARGGPKRPPLQTQAVTKKTYQPPKKTPKRAPVNRSERDYQRARHRR